MDPSPLCISHDTNRGKKRTGVEGDQVVKYHVFPGEILKGKKELFAVVEIEKKKMETSLNSTFQRSKYHCLKTCLMLKQAGNLRSCNGLFR